jgi:6-phosphogluconolactonase/glucosamine-6-phosphate isomerase/deaminase
MAFPGLGRTGFGAMNALCLTTTSTATIEWRTRPCFRGLRSPKPTFTRFRRWACRRDAAAAYEATLRHFYGGGQLNSRRALFDITLLGIGEDGHTASLFPNQSSLDERRRWVLDLKGPKGDPRITLTYPPLESSRKIVFLATGIRKRHILARVWSGDRSLPAARVHTGSSVHWFLDRAADPAEGLADGQRPKRD